MQIEPNTFLLCNPKSKNVLAQSSLYNNIYIKLKYKMYCTSQGYSSTDYSAKDIVLLTKIVISLPPFPSNNENILAKYLC